MAKMILVTGSSGGFGEMTAYQLADAGHIVYASMREPTDDKVEQARIYSEEHGVDLRTIALDVQDQASVDAAVAHIIAEQELIDVLVHNAGHMAFGPAKAFTPEQFASLHDINVVGPQRLNRTTLPHMRTGGGEPLIVWVASTSTRGGTPPYLAPYFAAKAAIDSLEISSAPHSIGNLDYCRSVWLSVGTYRQ